MTAANPMPDPFTPPPADLSRFDRDPDALTWARAKIQHQIDRLRDWEQQDRDNGNQDRAAQWRKMAAMLNRQFIGGAGCVIAAFDERKPTYARMLDNAQPINSQETT